MSRVYKHVTEVTPKLKVVYGAESDDDIIWENVWLKRGGMG